ncbi:MAG: hypothetical protein M5U08_06385 [Burkholderiales bacterium]|nr:hypothetical protein [Burkholderiales bacterium]
MSSPAISPNAFVGVKRSRPWAVAVSSARAHRSDHRAAEGLVVKRVAERADVRLLAHLRHHRRRERLHALLLLLLPGERERHEVHRLLRRSLELEQRAAATPAGRAAT